MPPHLENCHLDTSKAPRWLQPFRDHERIAKAIDVGEYRIEDCSLAFDDNGMVVIRPLAGRRQGSSATLNVVMPET